MSLGVPDFRASGARSGESPGLRALRVAGYVVFAIAVWTSVRAFYRGFEADRALALAQSEVTERGGAAQSDRRRLLRNGDLLAATASIESSLARVQSDLAGLLPPGVSLTLLKVDYGNDGLARVEAGVVAPTPEAYDRFLAALSRSTVFTDIKPGAESRPGLIRATVLATHRGKAEVVKP